MNPFGGDDDEDFEVEYLVNRNFQIGFLLIKDPDEEEKERMMNDVEVLGIGNIPEKLPTKLNNEHYNVDNEEDDSAKSSRKGPFKESLKLVDELKSNLHIN